MTIKTTSSGIDPLRVRQILAAQEAICHTDQDDNARRVVQAEAAVLIGTDYNGDSEDDRETYGGDLIANLMHWAEAYGIEWAELLRRGDNHYQEERGE
jgi:hypothetical protein